MQPQTDRLSPLSVHRAFVVQLRVETVPEHGRWGIDSLFRSRLPRLLQQQDSLFLQPSQGL